MRRTPAVPMLIESEDALATFIRRRRDKLELTQAKVAGVSGTEPPIVRQIEHGHGDKLELRIVRLVANALGLDLELRPCDATAIPVPPTSVLELGLSADALAALAESGLSQVDQIPSATELLSRSEFSKGVEVYEVVCALNRHGMTIPVTRDHILPGEREREMLRLRIVEGLTLQEIGDRFGVIRERVRQIHAAYFGLRGKPPAAKSPGSRRRRPPSSNASSPNSKLGHTVTLQ